MVTKLRRVSDNLTLDFVNARFPNCSNPGDQEIGLLSFLIEVL